MKKIIASLLLICSMLICLPSCGNNTEADKALKKLDTLAKNPSTDYYITIEVKNKLGEKITEQYDVSFFYVKRMVDYRIERLNSFTVDGESIIAPDEYKTVTVGSYDLETSAEARFDLPAFSFTDKALKDYKLEYGVFTAIIADPIEFFGKDLDCKDATLTVSYTESKINTVSISYKAESGNVTTITYTIK